MRDDHEELPPDTRHDRGLEGHVAASLEQPGLERLGDDRAGRQAEHHRLHREPDADQGGQTRARAEEGEGAPPGHGLQQGDQQVGEEQQGQPEPQRAHETEDPLEIGRPQDEGGQTQGQEPGDDLREGAAEALHSGRAPASSRGGRTRYQRSSPVARAVVLEAGEDEEQIREPVQVDEDPRVHVRLAGQRHHRALGAAADGARLVEERGGAAFPRAARRPAAVAASPRACRWRFSRRRTRAAVTAALARFAATRWVGSASWAPIAKRSLLDAEEQALEGLLGERRRPRRARRSSRPRRRRRRPAGGPWGRACPPSRLVSPRSPVFV